MSYQIKFIESYVHHGRIGVLVEFGVEDATTLQTETFSLLVKDLLHHIVASSPDSVDTLLAQQFVKDSTLTVQQLIANASGQVHEQITITRFVRWDTELQRPDLLPEPPRGPAVILQMRATK